jgi:hypothetical protein
VPFNLKGFIILGPRNIEVERIKTEINIKVEIFILDTWLSPLSL